MHTLEEDVPLRRSHLWTLLERYYTQHGQQAWARGAVPFFPTSNAAIAEGYARVIGAWAEDTGRPAQVVELGAGHGQFGYRCIQALRRRGVPFHYTLTDVVQANLDAWDRSRFLRPFLQQGLAASARVDVSAPDPAVLPEGPLVVVANYCFDSLITDVFRLKDGVLLEGRPVLSSEDPITDDPALIDKLDLSFGFHPIEPGGYYGDAELDGVLGGYRERMGSGTFCFPLGALRGLQALLSRPDPVLLLSVDKGRGHLYTIAGSDTVGFARHGSFSFLVNYDAIAQLFAGRGGASRLYSPRVGGPLEGGAFWSGIASCPRTAQAFDDHLESFNPSDLVRMYEAVRDHVELDLTTFLSMLRLSRFDPTVYCALYERVLDEAVKASPVAQRTLLAAADTVWQNAFPLPASPDVAFAIGRTYHRLHRYTRALERYRDSLDLCGAHHATLFNMGLCFHHLGQDARARAHFQQSIKQKQSFGPAWDWLVRVEP